VIELAKVLTPENRHEVVPRFFHRSKREAMAEVAAMRPVEAPPRREVVTAVRAPALAVEVPPARVDGPPPAASKPEMQGAPVQPAGHLDANSSPRPQQGRASELPLTADLSRLHVTVSRRFLAKLEAARAALSHIQPGASAEQILEAGLDLVLAQHAKRKGLVANAQTKRRPSKPDHVPAHVMREVWTRDGGRCQHPLHSGGICSSTDRVEVHHVQARALGGPATVENLSLRCRFHNDLEARGDYGDDWMGRFTDTLAKRGGPSRGEGPRTPGATPT
jgi:hypothetical protein